jgi:hypothetical protein
MKNILSPPGADDTDTSTGDIPEPDVESTEVGSNNDENTQWLPRVFHLWKEFAVETERNRDFIWLIEISLQDVSDEINNQSYSLLPRKLNMHWLKSRSASKTWRSCLFWIVLRIFSWSSGMERGFSVFKR